MSSYKYLYEVNVIVGSTIEVVQIRADAAQITQSGDLCFMEDIKTAGDAPEIPGMKPGQSVLIKQMMSPLTIYAAGQWKKLKRIG